MLLTFVGWALDTIFKPRLTRPVAARRPIGSWRDLRPLLMLLLLLFVSVTILELMTGLRIIAVVMLVVPVIAVAWVMIQTRAGVASTADRLRRIAFADVPSYQSELVLLITAGIIGTVGAALLQPLVAGQSFVLFTLPGWAILILLVWLIPLLGQIGMNPILGVSLLAPLLPTPAAMGVSPNAVVVALTAGWALAGATSPFTATTMLVGRLGHTTAWRVGLVWNRSFTIITGLVLSTSVALAGLL